MSKSAPAREHLTIEPAYAPSLRAHGLDSLAGLMNATAGSDLDKPGLAGWRQRRRLELDEQTLFIKRYRRPPLRAQLAARLAGHQAVGGVEWHWLHWLRAQQIPTPPPVAFGYQRCAGLECHSVLVTAGVPGRSLQAWLERGLERHADATADRTDLEPGVDEPGGDAGEVAWLADPAYRRAVRTAVARLVARLHEAGLCHRDLYISHIFFEPRPDPAAGLVLIDLQRVIRPRLRRRRWRIKDLAALNYSVPRAAASNAERLRWFKAYRQSTRLTRADKALIRAVVTKTRRIARHDRRRKAALTSTT